MASSAQTEDEQAVRPIRPNTDRGSDGISPSQDGNNFTCQRVRREKTL